MRAERRRPRLLSRIVDEWNGILRLVIRRERPRTPDALPVGINKANVGWLEREGNSSSGSSEQQQILNLFGLAC